LRIRRARADVPFIRIIISAREFSGLVGDAPTTTKCCRSVIAFRRVNISRLRISNLIITSSSSWSPIPLRESNGRCSSIGAGEGTVWDVVSVVKRFRSTLERRQVLRDRTKGTENRKRERRQLSTNEKRRFGKRLRIEFSRCNGVRRKMDERHLNGGYTRTSHSWRCREKISSNGYVVDAESLLAISLYSRVRRPIVYREKRVRETFPKIPIGDFDLEGSRQ